MKKVHTEQINNAIEAVKAREVKNIYFVACGGSLASLQTGEYFVDKEVAIPSKAYTSNEFLYSPPKDLGENSIVILRSHSGTTPETVKAATFAKNEGALTISISMDEESPLCKASEFILHYNYKEGTDAVDEEVGIYFSFLFKLLNVLEGNEKHLRVVNQLDQLGELLEVNKKSHETVANEFGKRNKREDIIYTMASGAYYPHAYSFTSCLLMEMLWINSNAVHTGEYFHGPFEITDYDVPFLIIKGEGKTQFLDERSIEFAKKFSENVEVLDVTAFDYGNTDKDLREFFGPAIVGAVLRLYADGLAEHTGHPLSVRRYMWKMEY